MKTFVLGVLAGSLMGAGAVLAVHPMGKKEIKKVYKRAGKLMNKMNCRLRRSMC